MSLSDKIGLSKGILKIHVVSIGTIKNGCNILCKHEFLVGRNYIYLNRGVVSCNERLPLSGHRPLVPLLIQVYSKMLKSLDSLLTNWPPHLTNPCRKNYSI